MNLRTIVMYVFQKKDTPLFIFGIILIIFLRKAGGEIYNNGYLNEKIIKNCIYVSLAFPYDGGAECVYPDSNILTSVEGESIKAKDIKEGNDIVYYNFEIKETEVGKVEKVYIHKEATDFVRYEFEDGSYLEATDYHPIYTETGWKSLTRRNGYEKPVEGDKVKTEAGWKKITKIEKFNGLEDCYDFVVRGKDGKIVNNYFANGTLVQGSY